MSRRILRGEWYVVVDGAGGGRGAPESTTHHALVYRRELPRALSTNPSATTVTAPITLCQSHETDGAPKFTAATVAIPAIRPKNAPVARARGIMASRKTPRMEP